MFRLANHATRPSDGAYACAVCCYCRCFAPSKRQEKKGAHTRLATGSITLGEVTALDHERLDDTMEGRALVAETLLSSGQGAEVLGGLGDGLAVETNDNAAGRLVANGDVEVDLVGDLGALGGGGSLREADDGQADQ